MDDLVRQVIAEAIPQNESLKSNEFNTSVKYLQDKIIELFRFSSLQYVPPFLNVMLKRIKEDAKSQDKRKRYGSAVCVTALIQLFPFDDYVAQFKPVIDELLVPGYKPIVKIGAIVAGKLARISGPKRDIYLRALVESSGRKLGKGETIDTKYAACVILNELSRAAPDIFFATGMILMPSIVSGMQSNEQNISELLIGVIENLFTSESASVGFTFLTEMRELFLVAASKNFSEAKNVQTSIVNFQLLEILLKIKPFVTEKTAQYLLLPECTKNLLSTNFDIVVYSIETMIQLHKIKSFTVEFQLYEKMLDLLFAWALRMPTKTEPCLSNVLREFPENLESKTSYLIQQFDTLCSKLPPDMGPLICYKLTVSAIESLPPTANITILLSNVTKLIARSSVPLPIQKIIRKLNISRPKWPIHFIMFKNQIFHSIRQELTTPSVRTDRLLISLLALRRLPVPYNEAVELNSLVIKLTKSKDREVRERIGEVTIHLFSRYPDKLPLGTVLKLVRFALNDSHGSVRIQTLKSFTEITYRYLVQPDVFEEFCRFMYDESPDVRKHALDIIRELPFVNGTVTRNLILSSLKQMNSNFNDFLPEAAPVWIMFPHLISSSAPLLHIYADAIYEYFIEMLNRRFTETKYKEKSLIYMNSAILSIVDESLIKSISRLHILCPRLVPLKPILQIFVKILKQPVHPWTKINVLKSLKNLAIVDPIIDLSPELIPTLLELVRENISLKLVTKTLKVIGSIGFSDFHTVEKPGPLIFRSSISNNVQFNHYYLMTLFKYLNHLFETVNLISTRESITHVITNVFSWDPSIIPQYIQPFMSNLLNFMEKSNDEKLPVFFKYLVIIIEYAGHVISTHTERIFQAIEEHWHTNYTREASVVLSALVVATKGHCRSIIHLLISVSFLLIKSKKDIENCSTELFNLIKMIAKFSPSNLATIIAGVISVINNQTNSVILQTQSLDTLDFIITFCNVNVHSSQIKRCLMTVSQRGQVRWRERANQILNGMNSIGKSQAVEQLSTTPPAPKSVVGDISKFIDKLTPPEKKSFHQKAMLKWFLEFRDYLLNNSPAENIRVLTVLPDRPKFAFEFAFMKIWFSFDHLMQKRIGVILDNIFQIEVLPEFVFFQFIDLVEFSVLCEVDIGVDRLKLVDRCISARFFAKALFFLETYLMANEKELDSALVEKIVKLNEHVGRHDESRAIALKHQDIVKYNVWMTLGEWDLALENIKKEHNPESNLNDYVTCLAATDNYKDILNLELQFEMESPITQTYIARYYWMAFLHNSQFDKALEYVNKTGGYLVEDCIQSAILYIKLKKYDEATDCVHIGWRYLGAAVSAVEKHNKTLIKKRLFQSVQLHELSEILNFFWDPEKFRINLHNASWQSRLALIENDPLAQKELFKIRSLIPQSEELDDFAFHILKVNAKNNRKQTSSQMIEVFFPDETDCTTKFARIRLLPKDQRIQACEDFITKCDEKLRDRVKKYMGKQIYFNERTVQDAQKALDLINSSSNNLLIAVELSMILSYIQPDSNYPLETMKLIQKIIEVKPEKSNLFLHQILALVIAFNNNDEMIDVATAIVKKLPASKLLVITSTSLQLVSNEIPAIFNFGKLICERICQAFPQAIAFDLPEDPETEILEDLVDYIQIENPICYNQSKLIQRKLIKVSNSLYDQWCDKLYQIGNLFNREKKEEAQKLLDATKQTLYQANLTHYEQEFVNTFLTELEECTIDNARYVLSKIIKKQDSIRMIPLSSLDEQLERKTNWILSMLGSDGFEGDVKINKFFHSVQRLDNGLKLTIIGNNGKKYNYQLLKGAMEHSNQAEEFMDLLNSISPTNTLIQRSVIELSPTVNLIQLLKGHLQMYDLIALYNKSKGKDDFETKNVEIYDIYSFGNEMKRKRRIQAYHYTTGYSDLAQAFLVTSKNAMGYLHRVSMFSQTLGALSAVSYLFGSVDTSPDGILIDKSSGAVTYTKFIAAGQCQAVPFRLTKMIEFSFGTCGVSGPFIKNLSAVLKEVRKKANSLAPCLQFTICQPPFNQSCIPKKFIERYSGSQSSEKNDPLDLFYERIACDETPHDKNIQQLIEAASSIDNIIQMPADWYPWW